MWQFSLKQYYDNCVCSVLANIGGIYWLILCISILYFKNKLDVRINREVKQNRFWATYVNRKWSLCNFKRRWRYQMCICQCLYHKRGDFAEKLGKTNAQERKKSSSSWRASILYYERCEQINLKGLLTLQNLGLHFTLKSYSFKFILWVEFTWAGATERVRGRGWVPVN